MNIILPRLWIPLALLGVALASGCSTFVRGGKPSDEQDGVHYWLPKPILRATPNSNGTLTVVVDSVPDMRHEYVVSASSLFGKYKFEAKVDKGLLTEVAMSGDSSDTAKSAVEAASAIEKAQIAAELKAIEAREEALKARDKSIKDAMAKVLEKKRVVIKLRAEREKKFEQGFDETSDEIKAVDLQITDALNELAFAEEDLAALLAERSAGDNQDGGQSRHNADAGAVSFAWGPAIYQIDQWIDRDGLPNVVLVAAEWNDRNTQATQLRFQTSVTGNPVISSPRPDVQMFTVAGFKEISPVEDKLQLIVESKIALQKIQQGQVQNASFATVGVPLLSLQQGGKEIRVDLPAELAAGRYYLTFEYEQDDAVSAARKATIEFSVKR